VTANRPTDPRVERFDDLYRATRTEILAYLLRRTPRREDAADVLGDVYLTAWRRVDDLTEGDDARLWLYGTARRTLANHRRRDATATGIADTLRNELRVNGPASASEPTDATTAAVHDALDKLDPDNRELLTLTAWEGLTPAEIATITDEAPGTIRVRLHRARAELRNELERLGVRGYELAEVDQAG
jgi:RNA polymerase sigma factor (sigma-70 family)